MKHLVLAFVLYLTGLAVAAWAFEPVDVEVTYDRQKTAPVEVDPKDRAQDYVDAFKEIRSQPGSGKVYVQVRGQTLSDVVNMKVMGNNGTLVLITMQNGSRVDSRLVKVEEIDQVYQYGDNDPVTIPSGW